MTPELAWAEYRRTGIWPDITINDRTYPGGGNTPCPVEPDSIAHYVPRDPLTFAQLSDKTATRSISWGPASKEFRAIELGGEAGELVEALIDGAQIAAAAGKTLNAFKKRLRFENGMPGGVEAMDAIEDELGDVVISAANLARALEIDLGRAVRRKFNKTSDKHGFQERL